MVQRERERGNWPTGCRASIADLYSTLFTTQKERVHVGYKEGHVNGISLGRRNGKDVVYTAMLSWRIIL